MPGPAAHPPERHEAPFPRRTLPSPDLCPGGGTGHGQGRAFPRRRRGPPRARLPFERHTRRRQNHHCPHLRQGAQLRARPRSGALQPVRAVPQNHPGRACGCGRNRRRVQQQRGRCTRPAREHRLRPHGRPLQDLYCGRSPHALAQRLQRSAQNSGRAAGKRGLHLCHHRGPQISHHHCEPLPALRLPPSQRRRPGRSPFGRAAQRECAFRGRRGALHCPPGGGQRARRHVAAGPDPGPGRGEPHRGYGPAGAGPGRTGIFCRTFCGPARAGLRRRGGALRPPAAARG